MTNNPVCAVLTPAKTFPAKNRIPLYPHLCPLWIPSTITAQTARAQHPLHQSISLLIESLQQTHAQLVGRLDSGSIEFGVTSCLVKARLASSSPSLAPRRPLTCLHTEKHMEVIDFLLRQAQLALFVAASAPAVASASFQYAHVVPRRARSLGKMLNGYDEHLVRIGLRLLLLPCSAKQSCKSHANANYAMRFGRVEACTLCKQQLFYASSLFL